MKSSPIPSRLLLAASAAVLCAFAVSPVHADSFGSGGNAFTLPFVPIGNAGNANDTVPDSFNGGHYGGVSYNYNMSVIDVSQTMLADAATLSGFNLGGGAWTLNQPAANVTWYEAAAFVNWLNTSQGFTAAYNLTFTSGQPTGLTLWTGPNIWTLGGADPFRNANTHYFLPSENEWYKAAFYNPGTSSYYLYATGSNTTPTAVLNGTTAGTAVFTGNSVSPTAPAAVDQSGGLSPYGTQGQTGNVYQWMETDFLDPTNSSDGDRVARGDPWLGVAYGMQSSTRGFIAYNPSSPGTAVGFRVASAPEPSCAALLLGGTALLALRRRRNPAGA
jgi:hypothetical protein